MHRVSSAQRDRALTTKPLLSVEDTAILLGQSRSSIYRAIERGDLPLPAFTINGRWRIPRRAVERLLAGDIDVRHQVIDAAPGGPRTVPGQADIASPVPGT